MIPGRWTFCIFFAAALMLFKVPSPLAQVYTWTDEKGLKHYSNKVPGGDVDNLEIEDEIEHQEIDDKAHQKEIDAHYWDKEVREIKTDDAIKKHNWNQKRLLKKIEEEAEDSRKQNEIELLKRDLKRLKKIERECVENKRNDSAHKARMKIFEVSKQIHYLENSP